MALPSSILIRGTLAAQPAATTVAAGTVYFITDKGIIQQSDGTNWLTFGNAVSGPTTVIGLPAAATVGAGTRAFVTDATATTFHSTVAGTGSNKVPVVSDGTSWLIG